MRLFLVLTLFSMLAISCRTTSASIKAASNNRSEVSCAGNEFPAGVMPGGLYGTKRVIYNQSQVPAGIIHPAMTEQDASGSLGLYHTYVPGADAGRVNDALAEIKSRSLAVTGVSDYSINGNARELKLSGTDKSLNIFRIDALKLSQARYLEIDVPAGSNVVIVTRGDAASFTAGILKSNVPADKILWSFPEAVSVTVRGGNFVGTVVAPDAQVLVDSTFSGSAYGGNLRATFVKETVLFKGCLPAR